jgi:hypothetical protein
MYSFGTSSLSIAFDAILEERLIASSGFHVSGRLFRMDFRAQAKKSGK